MDAHDQHAETIREEFTRQSAGFNAAEVMNGRQALGALVDAIPAGNGERWLETACGPGIVSRALAPRVGEMRGLDLTPAMLELARKEAAAAGLDNTSFDLGDATSLPEPDDSFDGAVNRFSLHHIPGPQRVLEEMGRVVKPGGAVVIADAFADPDHEAAAWREEIERLRDPSHWAFLTIERMRQLGTAAGLELENEEVVNLVLPFEDWLDRGDTGPDREALVRRLSDGQPASATKDHVIEMNGPRQLDFSYWLSVWRAR